MKYKPNNVFKILGATFLGTGIVLAAIGGGILFSHMSFVRNNPSTHAVIEDIYTSTSGNSSGKNVYVSYEAGENEYYNQLGYFNSNMREGDIIKIYYREDDPEDIMADTYLGEIITGSISLFFTGLGAVFLLHSSKQKKRLRNLFKNGIRADATVTGILTDYSTSVNGKNPVYLTCQITNTVTGHVTEYHSETTFSDLTPFLGETVTVYANPSNPEDAYVDIRSLVESQIQMIPEKK